jgi:transmembrane sensor
MEHTKAVELLEKYKTGTITDDEMALLESWYIHEISTNNTYDGLEENLHKLDKTFSFILRQEPQKKPRTWPRIAAAASILLFISIGLYFFQHRSIKVTSQQFTFNDIAPGGNKAILTLANGRQIVLTDAQNGQLASESNAIINKTANGQVSYNVAGRSKSEIVYNTLSTPRGGQYRLTLSDGTIVFLNAASSLTYPATFTGNERKVTLTGEAYFEVAHHASKPFSVITTGQVVEVLGTHFNVNSYDDEPYIRTTLIQGSVKVSGSTSQLILHPGQQSILMKQSLQVNEADIEETIAWTNGYFRFNDSKIESVMRSLSRWYDIDVIYEGSQTDEGFTGKISRFKNISQVLTMLEKTKAVHFKVEGRRVTVMQ